MLTQVVEDGLSKHDLRGACCFQEGPAQGGALPGGGPSLPLLTPGERCERFQGSPGPGQRDSPDPPRGARGRTLEGRRG